ncbi:BRO family, N-terminal domain protein [Peptoniphilus duerdenii ATCC BAA-1640]|uniref:BRO family, N-terminal domain protein n=2 Tax=Peptoniphilus TaxID=162289 RepID=E0NJX5_9FIRM|nr:BRO family, N-terminal domain protein [Peptoniphilus duerdenii ATCC BAA-1640]
MDLKVNFIRKTKEVFMNIEIFRNSEFKDIRTMVMNGEPWFVGKDIAENLGYSNSSKAVINHVETEDKQFIMLDLADSQNGNVPKGQTKTAVINESGLYSLILSSKLPQAKKFKRWVTSEVLPSIRRHGMYATDELLDNPDLFILVLEELKRERQEKLILKQQNLEMKPKASYYDIVLSCKEAVAITVISKDYGWSARKMNKKLHELGVQFKQGNIWLLYQDYAEEGYTCTKTYSFNKGNGEVGTKIHTYWTQKGRLFIYNLLKSEGYVPLIEIKEAA